MTGLGRHYLAAKGCFHSVYNNSYRNLDLGSEHFVSILLFLDAVLFT